MDRPTSFVFEATQSCNHACLHCYNVWKNAAPYPPGQLPTAETLELLDLYLEQSGAELCTLSGGEPLLRSDIFEIVDFLVERRRAINLITNGALLGPPALDRLAPSGQPVISVFELPLLSADAEIHDRMSGAPGAFHQVTDAIAELKLRGQTVIGVFVATRLNLPGWRETLELGVALGLDGMMLNRFNPGGAGFTHLEQLQASPAELEAALAIAEEESGRFDFPIGCSIAMPPCLIDTDRYQRLTFGFCAAGTERAYYTLDPLGNLRPCNHSPTILGNILDGQTFDEMAGGEAMQAFMAARPDACAGCRLELVCLGGCKAAAEACFGSVSAMDPFLKAFFGQRAGAGRL